MADHGLESWTDAFLVLENTCNSPAPGTTDEFPAQTCNIPGEIPASYYTGSSPQNPTHSKQNHIKAICVMIINKL